MHCQLICSPRAESNLGSKDTEPLEVITTCTSPAAISTPQPTPEKLVDMPEVTLNNAQEPDLPADVAVSVIATVENFEAAEKTNSEGSSILLLEQKPESEEQLISTDFELKIEEESSEKIVSHFTRYTVVILLV